MLLRLKSVWGFKDSGSLFFYLLFLWSCLGDCVWRNLLRNLYLSLKTSLNHHLFFSFHFHDDAPKCLVLTFKDPSVFLGIFPKLPLLFLFSLFSIIGLLFVAFFLQLIVLFSSFFLIKDLFFPLVWVVIVIRVFIKKKLIPAQKGTPKDIIFRKWKDNKDDIFSFQNAHC